MAFSARMITKRKNLMNNSKPVFSAIAAGHMSIDMYPDLTEITKEDFIRLVADFMSTESDKESKLAEMYQYIHDDAVTTFNEQWTEVEVEE